SSSANRYQPITSANHTQNVSAISRPSRSDRSAARHTTTRLRASAPESSARRSAKAATIARACSPSSTSSPDRATAMVSAPPALEPELEGRVPGAVEGARPPRADRPGPAHHVQELMILEAGERLRDRRVGPAGEAQERGEAVGQPGAARARIAQRLDRDRIAE